MLYFYIYYTTPNITPPIVVVINNVGVFIEKMTSLKSLGKFYNIESNNFLIRTSFMMFLSMDFISLLAKDPLFIFL